MKHYHPGLRRRHPDEEAEGRDSNKPQPGRRAKHIIVPRKPSIRGKRRDGR